MPIIKVEVVLRPGERLAPGLARNLADAAAQVFETPAGETWVRLTTIEAGHYAENGAIGDEGTYPVFVTILRYTLPGRDALEEEAHALVNRFAPHLDRPPVNIHLHFLPDGRGTVAFGGELVE